MARIQAASKKGPGAKATALQINPRLRFTSPKTTEKESNHKIPSLPRKHSHQTLRANRARLDVPSTKLAHYKPLPQLSSRRGQSKSARRKTRVEHPLFVDFKEATTTYRNTLISQAGTKLEEITQSLFTNLNQSAGFAIPFTGKTSELDGSPITPVAHLTQLLEPFRTPLSAQVLNIVSRTSATQKASVADRVASFRALIARERQTLRELAVQHQAVMHELYWLSTAALGKEKTQAIRTFADRPRHLNTLLPPPTSALSSATQVDAFADENNGNDNWQLRPPPKSYGTVPSTLPPLPPMPTAPATVVSQLREKISKLGDEQLATLHNEEELRIQRLKNTNKAIAKAVKNLITS